MSSAARPLCLALACLLAAGCAAARLRREGASAYEQGAYEEAIAKLELAVKLDPSDLELRLDLRSRREGALQQLIFAADYARARGDGASAASSYQRALSIAPGNDRALRGLEGVQGDRKHAERIAKAAQVLAARQPDAAELEVRAVLSEDPGFAPATALLAQIEAGRGATPPVPRLRSRDDRPVSLQFRDASTKMVFEALARQTGLNFIFDKEIKSDSKTTIFVNQVPVEQAIDLILAQGQFGRQVLSENIAIIYPNTPAKQKDYRDEVVHTFYLTNAAPKDAESMLKTVLGAKTLFVDERSSTLIMRDTPEHVRMAEKLVASLDLPQPEVIMEVEVLEITHSVAEKLGINYPGSFSVGASKPPNSDGGSATGLVWSDLFKQNKNTLIVSSLGVSADFLKTVGASNVLSSPRIRARNKEKAKIVVGNRLPVVTSGTSATTGGSFSTSSVSYVEAGLTLEVTPTIHNNGNVAIKVSLEVSSILNRVSVNTGSGSTLAYEIGTRNASTLLELKDGETQVLAGLIQDTDQRGSSHIPGLGDIPILGRLFGATNNSRDKNEVVLSITPRIIRSQPRPSSETTEFWYGSESQTRSRPFASSAAGAPGASNQPFVPGGVSMGGGPAATTAPPPSGPRATPTRVAASAGPHVAPAAAAAPPADGTAPDSAAAAVDNAPKVTIEGPETAKVGEEVSVSVKLASVTSLGRIRTQVRFDASALQLVSADAGDLAPSDAPKVETRAGGVQLELVGSEGAPLSGVGALLNLRFRVVLARPEISISTQVVLVGEDGAALAATQATPLKIAAVK